MKYYYVIALSFNIKNTPFPPQALKCYYFTPIITAALQEAFITACTVLADEEVRAGTADSSTAAVYRFIGTLCLVGRHSVLITGTPF